MTTSTVTLQVVVLVAKLAALATGLTYALIEANEVGSGESASG